MSVLMSLKAVAMSAAIMLPVSHAYDTGYQMNNDLVYQQNDWKLKALKARQHYLQAQKRNIIGSGSRILYRQRRIQQNHRTLNALEAEQKYLRAQKLKQQQYRNQQQQYHNQPQQYRNQHMVLRQQQMQFGRKPARPCNLQQAGASQPHCVGEPMLGSAFGTRSVYLGTEV